MSVEIKGIKLIETCWACPEQYDAYNGRGQKIGYLRLRHGSFTVDVPDCGGETILNEFPNGDGRFEDKERSYYLNKAVSAIKDYNRKLRQERKQ